MKPVVAVDLAPSGGRVMKVGFTGDGFTLDMVHRFQNQPVQRRGHLTWNIQQLWGEAVKGIERALDDASSVAVDSWGADYGLLDSNGNLLENPVNHRDPRTRGVQEWVFGRIPRRRVFDLTGAQFTEGNTLSQMASVSSSRSRLFRRAETYLGFPDLFNYWLTGGKMAEYTHASTTQLYNPVEEEWSREIMEAVKIPVELFPPVTRPGAQLGDLRGVPVIASASHDVASAVAAVPSRDRDFMYICCGGWSLLGTEVPDPVISDQVYSEGFTNMGGAAGSLLMKRLTGRWLEEELLREWQGKGVSLTMGDVVESSEKSEPFKCLIDPMDPLLRGEGEMTTRIKRSCVETGQQAALSVGEFLRCVHESLALNYRRAAEELEAITGKRYKAVHVLGEGSGNTLQNRFTAEATGKRVIVGPEDAAVLGNAAVQLVGLGAVGDVWEARRVASESSELQTIYPSEPEQWEDAYTRFLTLKRGA